MRMTAYLFAAVLASSPAWAQGTTPAAPAATPAPAATSAPAATHRPTPMETAIERRITELHSSLKITAAQQKPFDDFANVMRDNAHRMAGLVQTNRTAASNGSAVDQMKAYSDLAQAHAEDMSKLVPAFSTLYDSLSPDQKKMADQSFRSFAQREMRRRS